MSHISSVFIRTSLVITVLAGAICMQSEDSYSFNKREKAYYASAAVINFVRPGLVFKVASAQIAQDGTITARVLVTDPKGIPLDRAGIVTPGAVSISLIAATIPKGKTQYTSYAVRTETSPDGKQSAIQAAADSGGTFTANDVGDYTYTFKTKAPSGFDASATHTIGVYGSRNLSDFNLGTNYASTTFNFVPNGSPVTVVRDVIRTQSCNKCHDQLSFHGGSRRGVELCILCHTPQTTDAETGNTVDFKVFIHKVHMGSGLPSVQAGTSYQIIGFNQAVSDWSKVVFPSDARRCESCHEQNTGATQATAYFTPNRVACGACHDNVNFATGLNHVNLPQVDDTQCANCHIPQGELEFDASIKGAHTIPTQSTTLPGININILKVNNGTAGSAPAITFTLKDNAGNPILASDLTKSPNRLAAVLAGPTTDYGYTNFGSDVTTNGYVSEDATKASCGSDGTCVYQFLHAVPANAKGTFSIGMEGRRGATLLAGTTIQQTTEYGAINKVINFSVDGSPIVPRRKVVDIAKCNGCHTFLSVHGENRNQIEMCVLCHNPSESDISMRPLVKDPAIKNAPAQAINFSLMIHKIHDGEYLASIGQPLTIAAFGGSVIGFNDVVFPAFSPSGSVGNVQSCTMCHVNGSENNLPVGLNDVRTPNSLLTTTPAATAACTACHATKPELSHAVANTTQFGESCTACHGPNGDFTPDKVHAQ
ncbi:MAG TPA: OmcA/MtrC family decaheme c-type cytochrome [Bryobacteraceae bacterium]|nr:OmcA/MtrC family decaheme c-type cytochrome [Bryobacteraceae bacterium]